MQIKAEKKQAPHVSSWIGSQASPQIEVLLSARAHHRLAEEEGCAAASLPLPPMEEHGGALAVSAEEKNRPPSATSCLLPARSLRSTTVVPVAAQAQAQADVRSMSFSKLFFSYRMARAPSSLDYIIDQLDAAGASNSSDNKKEEPDEEKLKQVSRSQSVPTSVRRFGARAAASRRVADSSSLLGAAAAFRLRLVVPAAAGPGDETAAEDIAAEEAVCRICMVALSEGTAGAGRGPEEGAVLKLECCCKGELALAHVACAVKWFGIKGNGTCDVCSQEVLNLPVTLHSHHPSAPSPAAAAAQATQHQEQQQEEEQGRRYHRVWHGTPILAIISMLAYFCFLEQLLVGDHGTAALAISLPFACVLGLFSSLTTTKMVSRRCVWIYSAVQFLFIVLFTHLLYRYVRMQAVISIILSTFAGFSVAICANSTLLQILRWRARRAASPTTAAATTGDEEQGHGGSAEPPAVSFEVAPPPL